MLMIVADHSIDRPSCVNTDLTPSVCDKIVLKAALPIPVTFNIGGEL